jgi:hypothetical protein
LYENKIKTSSVQSSKLTGTWKGFLDLKTTILEHGIRYACQDEFIYIKKMKEEIHSNEKNVDNNDKNIDKNLKNIDKNLKNIDKNQYFYVHHGRHRLCILYFIYGKNIKFKVENNCCIGVKIKMDEFTTVKINLKIN